MKEIFTAYGITVYRWVMPAILSNMYLVLEGGQALIIDPHICMPALELLRTNGVENVLVLLSHEHFDHISGVNWLRENLTQVTVLCTEDCAALLGDPEKNMAKFYEALFMDMTPEQRLEGIKLQDTDYRCMADKTFAEELRFDWNGHMVHMQRAPGHARGGNLIWLDEKILFTGDNLVEGTGVILRFPGGSKREYAAITRPMLETVQEDTFVFPGHGEPGEMRDLRRYLEPFKRSASRAPGGLPHMKETEL